METNEVITFLACVIMIFLFGKIFFLPLKSIIKLVLNSILGAFIIYIINLVGAVWGFYIGLNIFTAVFVGLLGIPGAILLVIIKLLIG